jgi:hypothetical protein
VSDTITQQDPASAPAAQSAGNGFAVTSLVTGILGLFPFGLIFGFMGLSRAKKVGKGKGMAWTGIILSLAYLVAFVGGAVVLVPHIVKASDPGCQVAIKVNNNYPDSKVNADLAANPAVGVADLTAELSGLTDAASKAKNATAKADMQASVADITATLTSLASGQAPTAAAQAKSVADENALTKACGGF